LIAWDKHIEWGFRFSEENLHWIAYGTIIFGNFFLWYFVMGLINRFRRSALPTDHPHSIPNKKFIEQTTQADPIESNHNGHNDSLICPNCDTLLEPDAIRELQAKKKVFCASCGSQISFLDIFGDEKATVLEEHQRLMEKITKLPSVNGGVKKEREE